MHCKLYLLCWEKRCNEVLGRSPGDDPKRHLGFMKPLLLTCFFCHHAFRNPLPLSNFPHPYIHMHHSTWISTQFKELGYHLLNSGSSSPHFLQLLLIGPNQQPPSRLSSGSLGWASGDSFLKASFPAFMLTSLCPFPVPSQVFFCSLPPCPGKHAWSVHSLPGGFWIQRLCWQLIPGSFPSLAPGSLRSGNV